MGRAKGGVIAQARRTDTLFSSILGRDRGRESDETGLDAEAEVTLSRPGITVVTTQMDWMGIYVDGEQLWQGHPGDLEIDWLLQKLGLSVTSIDGEEELLVTEPRNRLPQKLPS
jgi:hypothetical protein